MSESGDPGCGYPGAYLRFSSASSRSTNFGE